MSEAKLLSLDLSGVAEESWGLFLKIFKKQVCLVFLCKKNWCDELLNASDFSDSLSTHAFGGKDWEILNGNFPHFLK